MVFCLFLCPLVWVAVWSKHSPYLDHQAVVTSLCCVKFTMPFYQCFHCPHHLFQSLKTVADSSRTSIAESHTFWTQKGKLLRHSSGERWALPCGRPPLRFIPRLRWGVSWTVEWSVQKVLDSFSVPHFRVWICVSSVSHRVDRYLVDCSSLGICK